LQGKHGDECIYLFCIYLIPRFIFDQGFSNKATPETQLHKNVIRCGVNIAFGAKEYFQ
jgi:hypothetical protein